MMTLFRILPSGKKDVANKKKTKASNHRNMPKWVSLRL